MTSRLQWCEGAEEKKASYNQSLHQESAELSSRTHTNVLTVYHARGETGCPESQKDRMVSFMASITLHSHSPLHVHTHKMYLFLCIRSFRGETVTTCYKEAVEMTGESEKMSLIDLWTIISLSVKQLQK